MWFGVIAYLCIAIPLGTIFNGWVLSELWLWFIVPTFHLQPISVVVACGISLLVSYVTFQFDLDKNKDEPVSQTLINSVGIMISKPLFALTFGYILQLFI